MKKLSRSPAGWRELRGDKGKRYLTVMSTIPKNRSELLNLIETSYEKLDSELDRAGSKISKLKCVDDWSVKELLAIRAWWTGSVIKWVRAGQKGKVPITPAKGYKWKETPKLNNDIAKASKKMSYDFVRKQLKTEYRKLIATINSLDDRELLRKGVFKWAGPNWPISRWLSVNTARQYKTARRFVKQAMQRSKR